MRRKDIAGAGFLALAITVVAVVGLRIVLGVPTPFVTKAAIFAGTCVLAIVGAWIYRRYDPAKEVEMKKKEGIGLLPAAGSALVAGITLFALAFWAVSKLGWTFLVLAGVFLLGSVLVTKFLQGAGALMEYEERRREVTDD